MSTEKAFKPIQVDPETVSAAALSETEQRFAQVVHDAVTRGTALLILPEASAQESMLVIVNHRGEVTPDIYQRAEAFLKEVKARLTIITQEATETAEAEESA